MPVKPLFVKSSQVEYSSVCSRCVDEKNARVNGRAWAPGESLEDVTVYGIIPRDEDLVWAVCRYGHRRLVLREGSDPANNFR